MTDLSTNPWVGPIKLEMKIADIISKQAKHGCNFKKNRASWLVHRVNEVILNIDLELVPMLPPMMVKGSSYARPFKLNGQLQKWPATYCDRVSLDHKVIGGPFSCIEFTPFDPGKVARVKQVMMDLGWIPTSWNEKKMPFQVWSYRKRLEKNTFPKFMESLPREEREMYNEFINGFVEKHFRNKSKNYMIAVLVALGFNVKRKTPTFNDIKKKLMLKQFWPTSPEITEDSFDSLEGKANSRALELLVERMQLCHRRGLLEGLIGRTRSDGKLSGEAASCATPTARMKHRINGPVVVKIHSCLYR